MNVVLSVKVTISQLVLNLENINTQDVILSISFNHICNIFKQPFNSLPFHLMNFPSISIMHFKAYFQNLCIGETSCSLEELVCKKSVENVIELKESYKDEILEKGIDIGKSAEKKTVGSFKIFIEKDDDIENCDPCSVYENFTSISEKVLGIIIEISKNIDNKYIDRINELGMEVHKIDIDNKVTPQGLKNIKSLLVGVNEKLKILDLLKNRNELLTLQVLNERKSRESMQEAVKHTCKELLNYKSKLGISGFGPENKSILLNPNKESLENIEKNHLNYKKSTETEIQTLKTQLELVEKGIFQDPRTEQIIKSLQSKVSFAENISNTQKTQFSKALQDYENLISQYQQQITDLSQENLILSNKITNLTKENQEILIEKNFIINESAMIKANVLEYEKKILYAKELELQMKKLEESTNKARKDYKDLQDEMEKLTQKQNERTQSITIENNKLMETNKKLNEEILQIKHENNIYINQILELKSKKSNHILKLPSGKFTSINSQNVKLLQDCKDVVAISNKFEADLIREYHVVLKNIVESSERHLQFQRVQTKFLKYLQEREAENRLLRELIIELQKDKYIYVPLRGDYIDNTLANYLNSRQNYCGVPFVRLDSGVYLFGTKRVIIRIENVGIVIRIGGGFLKIEDFINATAPIELNKLKDKERDQERRVREKEKEREKEREKEGKKEQEEEMVKGRFSLALNSKSPERSDRESSPQVAYTQRVSLGSSIPLPKSVSSKLQKQSSITTIEQQPKRPANRRGTII
ncbi:hypothetical protein SteCoe_4238 [Stentor coeruleus]|uniref:GAR domain-containing protein n=1 Tax=Stentor coeruleus TaxID=5963 RepID=A0A1R2CV61_9CILI|nr:hypothetical protein SteCoe_4238 [Stentor coeruleus]